MTCFNCTFSRFQLFIYILCPTLKAVLTLVACLYQKNSRRDVSNNHFHFFLCQNYFSLWHNVKLSFSTFKQIPEVQRNIFFENHHCSFLFVSKNKNSSLPRMSVTRSALHRDHQQGRWQQKDHSKIDPIRSIFSFTFKFLSNEFNQSEQNGRKIVLTFHSYKTSHQQCCKYSWK